MKEGLLVVFLYRSVRYSLLGFYLKSSDLIKNSPILVAIVRAYQTSIVCGVQPFLHSNDPCSLFLLYCYFFFSDFVQSLLTSYLVFCYSYVTELILHFCTNLHEESHQLVEKKISQ